MDTINDEYLDLTENSEDDGDEEVEEKEEANMFGLELPTFELPKLDLDLTDLQSNI